MLILTLEEYRTIRVFELENAIYNRIEAAFRRVLGNGAKAFLERHLTMKLRDLSANSAVDIMSCFTVI